MNCMTSPPRYSRFCFVLRNDQGNCSSRAPQLSRLHQRFQPFLEGDFIGPVRIALMRESLPELGRKPEVRIVGDPVQPDFHDLRLGRLVKGGVDLDGVEKFRQIAQLVKPSGPA